MQMLHSCVGFLAKFTSQCWFFPNSFFWFCLTYWNDIYWINCLKFHSPNDVFLLSTLLLLMPISDIFWKIFIWTVKTRKNFIRHFFFKTFHKCQSKMIKIFASPLEYSSGYISAKYSKLYNSNIPIMLPFCKKKFFVENYFSNKCQNLCH